MPGTTRGGADEGAPRGRGRPKGSVSAEPTVYLALRIPERILGPFRDRWGRRAAERIRALMDRDELSADT